MCVREGERCDGVPQCPDGSDETGCWTPTQECALRCDTATRCIPRSWLCDGHADCLDHTDEQGCGKTLGLDGMDCWGCLPPQVDAPDFLWVQEQALPRATC